MKEAFFIVNAGKVMFSEMISVYWNAKLTKSGKMTDVSVKAIIYLLMEFAEFALKILGLHKMGQSVNVPKVSFGILLNFLVISLNVQNYLSQSTKKENGFVNALKVLQIIMEFVKLTLVVHLDQNGIKRN